MSPKYRSGKVFTILRFKFVQLIPHTAGAVCIVVDSTLAVWYKTNNVLDCSVEIDLATL